MSAIGIESFKVSKHTLGENFQHTGHRKHSMNSKTFQDVQQDTSTSAYFSEQITRGCVVERKLREGDRGCGLSIEPVRQNVRYTAGHLQEISCGSHA